MEIAAAPAVAARRPSAGSSHLAAFGLTHHVPAIFTATSIKFGGFSLYRSKTHMEALPRGVARIGDDVPTFKRRFSCDVHCHVCVCAMENRWACLCLRQENRTCVLLLF